VNVVENTLAQRIREIREALGDGAHGARFIKTVPRVGCQFIAELDDKLAGALTGNSPEILGLLRKVSRRASEWWQIDPTVGNVCATRRRCRLNIADGPGYDLPTNAPQRRGH
jgi:hypothetical protein